MTYLLDSTILIEWLRGRETVEATMLRLLGRGDSLATRCVNLAEIEAGLRQRERRKAEAVLGHLRFLVTTPEAANRPAATRPTGRGGPYHRDPDALVAGTARAHGAVLVTHNTDDFSMSDMRVEHPDHVDA